jgi:hypothetical protein
LAPRPAVRVARHGERSPARSKVNGSDPEPQLVRTRDETMMTTSDQTVPGLKMTLTALSCFFWKIS